MEAPTGASPALTPGLQKAATLATREPFNEGLAGLTLQDILLSSVRNAGYIQAILDNLERTVAPSPADPQTLLVTYNARIVTGDPYKVSALTYKPHPPLLRSRLRPRCQAPPRATSPTSPTSPRPRQPSPMVYLSHGYLDIYILSHPAPDTAAHTVAYTLEPIPGDIYHLHTVTPTGPAARSPARVQLRLDHEARRHLQPRLRRHLRQAKQSPSPSLHLRPAPSRPPPTPPPTKSN